jgi:excisionase family DNA binding protein
MREMGAAVTTADELPEMLTVSEAARRLRIGRTLAYQLAARFLDGQPGGIPTIRLGGTLRVPSTALDEFMRVRRIPTPDGLTATVADAIDDYLGDGRVTGPTETPPGPRR